jgi:hypothetical protein
MTDVASLIDGLIPIGQNNTYTWGGVTAGSVNSQTVNMVQAPTAYADGQVFRLYATYTNTASMTLNVSGLGAITVYNARTAGAALIGNEVLAGGIYNFLYYSAKFYLLDGCPGFATWTPTITASGTMGVSATSNISSYYSPAGKSMQIWMNMNVTLAAPAATGIFFTMPSGYTISSVQPQYTSVGSGSNYNGTDDRQLQCRVFSNTLLLLQRYDSGLFAVGVGNQNIRAECRVILA